MSDSTVQLREDEVELLTDLLFDYREGVRNDSIIDYSGTTDEEIAPRG
jgi:hypothetical protein